MKNPGNIFLMQYYRENGQRNFISEGLGQANDDDLILISDVDEIPNLKRSQFKKLER